MASATVLLRTGTQLICEAILESEFSKLCYVKYIQIFFNLVQHSLSPEIGVHGTPVDNFSRSGSGGVNLSKLAVGLDLSEPASSKWSSTTSVKFEVPAHYLFQTL